MPADYNRAVWSIFLETVPDPPLTPAISFGDVEKIVEIEAAIKTFNWYHNINNESS